VERKCDQQVGLILSFFVLVPVLLHLCFFQAGVLFLQRKNMVRVNYQGRIIPTAGGLLLLFYYLVTVAAGSILISATGKIPFHTREWVMMVCGSAAMALWGWQDDCSRDKEVKGFRGHLGTLLQEGRMTSGLLKAWGGGATACIAALALSNGLTEFIVHAGLLAFATNLINLFDLRPTRAIKVFWLLTGITIALSWSALPAYLWILPALTASLLLFFPDARQQVMLGDTGSNFLGFLAGFLLMVTLPMPLKCFFLFIFILLHVLAEFISFSRVIEAVRWLRRIDQWGRQA
jgi:UDP-GlcNAc:undecaprenyl-phosphate GlcNAc-1-phosphate transferase